MKVRLHDGVSVTANQKGFKLERFNIYTLCLVGEDACGCHAHHTLHFQSASGIENIRVDDEVVVGHVELSRHILEQATHLERQRVKYKRKRVTK